LTFSKDFSARVILVLRNRRAGFPRGVTSSKASSSAIDKPFGGTPQGWISAGRKSVGEVSAYWTVCPELVREAARRRRLKPLTRYRWEMIFDRVPRWFCKA
jgi:hypothetical protein